MQKEKYTQFIRDEAYKLGFSFVGFAKAERMDVEAKRLEAWLNKGLHGQMNYLENHFDKRIDPTLLVDGAKTVVSFMFNYHNPEKQTDETAPKISMYAYGEDYHHVIKNKLKSLLEIINSQIGEVNGRAFVDSAPVLERDWANRAGVGWVGKNTLIINPKAGSNFFLAELIIDIELAPDAPMKDYCGTCTKCIEACPTNAIAPNGYLLDSTKCISYLTIELRDALPIEYQDKMENWMFGCDICQDVCPWNRFATKHSELAFEPTEDLLSMKKNEWLEITKEVFNHLFKKSAVKRTKFAGLKRNINFINMQNKN